MQAFPVKLSALWRQSFPGLVIGALVARAIYWIRGEPFSLPSTLPLMGVAAAMVVFMYFLQPTLCGATGLNLMTRWGYRRHLRWEQVETVTLARTFLLQPSLKIQDSLGRVHWIARETGNLKGLHALARQHGSPDHPLVRVLEMPLYELKPTPFHRVERRGA